MAEQKAPQLSLERLVDLVRIFPNSDIYSDTFLGVFEDYPPDWLTGLDEQRLEEVLENIAGRLDVNRLQATLEFELSGGEGNILNLAYIIFNRHIKGHQVPLTTGKEPNVYAKQYQEVKALCDACSNEVATGLFDRIPLEKIVFVPEQTLYARNLEGIFPDGNLTCDECGNRSFVYERTSFTVVLRDKKDKIELRRLVEDITRVVAEKIQQINPKRNLRQVKKDIVNAFYRMYKSVRAGSRLDGEVQYDKLYKLLEWIRRGNIQIDQLHSMDLLTRDLLKRAIDDYIPLPFAVLRMRVKDMERIYGKMIEVLYGLKLEEGISKELRDILGLRIILPTVDNCYTLLNRLQQDPDFKIENFIDYIKKPKPNGYQSLHVHITHGGIMYSIQIRTHEMDRAAETDPRQRHEEVYVPDQIKTIIDNVPYQVRRVFATILGVDKSPLLNS